MSMQQQPETGGQATGYGTGGQQQMGQPQQPTGGSMGQQSTGQGQSMGGQRMGQQMTGGERTFESSLSGPMRLALHDFVESLTACEWCADQCIDHGPEMAACVRLCRDVADLASTNIQLMARDSIFGPEAAKLFADAAEECARECARHPEPHCQECANALSRAVDSTRKMLASFQGGGMGQQGGIGEQSGIGQQQGGVGQSMQPAMGQPPEMGQQGGIGQQSGIGEQSGIGQQSGPY